MDDIRIILGIGNPGKEYQKTRHNIGFTLIDHIASLYGMQCTSKKWHALVAEAPMPASLGRGKLILVKPQTYVNVTGKSMQAILSFYKIPPQQCLVLVDDLNLELGCLRGRAQGSAGGHNGLKDIARCLGQNYPRLRMGIGSPQTQHPQGGDGHGRQVDFVLGAFAANEQADVSLMINKAVQFSETWITSGIDKALMLNGPLRPKPPKPKKARQPTTADVKTETPAEISAETSTEAPAETPKADTNTPPNTASTQNQAHTQT